MKIGDVIIIPAQEKKKKTKAVVQDITKHFVKLKTEYGYVTCIRHGDFKKEGE